MGGFLLELPADAHEGMHPLNAENCTLAASSCCPFVHLYRYWGQKVCKAFAPISEQALFWKRNSSVLCCLRQGWLIPLVATTLTIPSWTRGLRLRLTWRPSSDWLLSADGIVPGVMMICVGSRPVGRYSFPTVVALVSGDTSWFTVKFYVWSWVPATQLSATTEAFHPMVLLLHF